MAAHLFSRSRLPQPTNTLITSLISRSFSSSATSSSSSRRTLSIIRALSPLSAAANNINFSPTQLSTVRCLSTRPTSSSLNDPSPNWSNRPPKETILLDGCDFEHWLVVMDKPEGDPTRDEIIDSYIKTLAQIVGSEEEARMKIYSVSTRCYYAFGALVSEELSYKIKELPHVRWVLPDSYLDVKNKDYGGEPFINGQAVPYDPKYHEEWIRNNARANERNRRNDRSRNDRSRNFERRRENMQQQDRSSAPPMANQSMQNSQPTMGRMQQNMSRPAGPPSNYNMGGPQNNMSGPVGPGGPPPPPNYNMGGPQNNMSGPVGPGGPPPPPNNYASGMPNNMGGMPHNSTGGMPYNSAGGIPQNMGGMPQNNMGGMPYNSTGGIPQNNMGGIPQNNMGGMPQNIPLQNNMGGMPQNNMGMPYNSTGGTPQNNTGGMPQNMGGMAPNGGWSNNIPGNMQQNFQNGPNNGGMPYQGAQSSYQNNYAQNRDESMPGGDPYPA